MERFSIVLLILICLGVLVGIGLLCCGVRLRLRQKRLKKHGKHAEATITGIRTHPFIRISLAWADDNGQPRSGTVNLPGNISTTATVNVLYDDNSVARQDCTLGRSHFLCGAVVIALCLFHFYLEFLR
ncbi:MAG: hypothetical protein FWB76_02970 [Oscillospiraceae bacterium]|nr:hypothetical protein [Oscillospiraceae bacterium]